MTPSRPILHQSRRILLLTCAMTTAPLLPDQPLWLGLTVGFLILWAAYRLWQGEPRLPRPILLPLVILAIFGLIFEYRTLLGPEAGIATLTLFMAMKQHELSTLRDGFFAIFLGIFLLLANYLNHQGLLTAFWLLICLMALLTALINLHSPAEHTWSRQIKKATLILAKGTPFMLVFFIFFPRLETPLWQLPNAKHSAKMGLSESMSPGDISQLIENPEIAFRVNFIDPPPEKKQLYWRGPVLETFDGREWQTTPVPAMPFPMTKDSKGTRYEITLEPHYQHWIPALERVTRTNSNQIHSNRFQVVMANETVSTRQRFSLASVASPRWAIAEHPNVLRKNLLLPIESNPETRNLVQRWQADNPTPEQLVERALAFYRTENFHYTLSPPQLGTHTVDDFLFRTREGFCEHYASSFVVLMRIAGIPARVVTGYQGGEQNPYDGYWLIRQSDAHAWAEIWLNDKGWVRIDPTQAIAPNRIDQGVNQSVELETPYPTLRQTQTPWLRMIRFRWESLNNLWVQYILGYDAKKQKDFTLLLGLNITHWQDLILPLLCLPLLIACFFIFRTFNAKQKLSPEQRLWQKSIKPLEKKGFYYLPSETPSQYLEKIQQQDLSLAEKFKPVVDAYIQTRYGPPPLDLNPLKNSVSKFIKQCS